MRSSFTRLAVAATLMFFTGCQTETLISDGGALPDDPLADADLDTISDLEEGRLARLDTDADGILDYLDTDSDGDSIPDLIEAGDTALDSPALDSDDDGIADYLDLDSDQNGLPDRIEGTGDFDVDAVPNFADLDDDNDLVRDREELAGLFDPFIDSDGDGQPNFRDPDSDNDLIMDGDESGPDTDGDGLRDIEDRDSDGDSISDLIEAGDADVFSAPVDSDNDNIPDFRDPDSDGDGLSDRYEHEMGLDPTQLDSDRDGVNDLIELAAGTDANDPDDSPTLRGDFVFVVPYESDPMPTRDSLVFTTSLRRADVHFMIDTSISMQGYIDTVRNSLRTTIVPGVAAAIPDVSFGVGQFDVCPSAMFSPGTCRGIAMDQTSTSDSVLVDAALGSLTTDCLPVNEPYAQAAWVWATGDTSRFPGMTAPSCPAGTTGLGCVREGAMPILVVIGDEQFAESYRTQYPHCQAGQCASCESFPQSADLVNAFNAIGGRLIVLGRTGTSPEWGPIVAATGAVDSSGDPLVFGNAGSGTVDRALIDAIDDLARSTPLDVTARVGDLDDDGFDATSFIERIEPNTVGGVADRRNRAQVQVCQGGLPTGDSDGDGVDDTFLGLAPGAPVCFDIVVRRNDSVPPTDEPQVFRALVEVAGDGVATLDTRIVYFLVPPAPPSVIAPD